MSQQVLFVCLGNICRSPTGEAVLNRSIATLGVDVQVDSAGTIAAHVGHRADPRMRAAGEARGYRFDSRARQVTADDLRPGRFDYVIAMDRENLQDLRRLAAAETDHIVLLSDFLDSSWPRDVPDPYYGGPDGFEQVLDMIEAAVPAILKRLADRQT